MSIPVNISQDGTFWLLVRSVQQSRQDNDFAIVHVHVSVLSGCHTFCFSPPPPAPPPPPPPPPPLPFLCINCGSTMFDLYVQIIYFSLLACYSLFLFFTRTRIVKAGLKFELVREKTNNLGLRPGQIQTRLSQSQKKARSLKFRI